MLLGGPGARLFWAIWVSLLDGLYLRGGAYDQLSPAASATKTMPIWIGCLASVLQPDAQIIVRDAVGQRSGPGLGLRPLVHCGLIFHHGSLTDFEVRRHGAARRGTATHVASQALCIHVLHEGTLVYRQAA